MTDGILVVNKPKGMSSAAVVGRLKRMLNVKKIGHTGTLDPFATGVLLIAVGKATRISRFFLDGIKGYRARVTLGIQTDTYDCTGRTVHRADRPGLDRIGPGEIREVAASFAGPQEQVAPAFSALKHQGQPLYKLARQGKMIQKPPRQIEIFDIAVIDIGTSPEGLPEFEVDVVCSGGTYIRSLAHDMGQKLGCGAHLSGLCRTRSGRFTLEDAAPLEEIQAMDRPKIDARIVAMSACLDSFPAKVADAAVAEKIRYGQQLSDKDLARDESGEPTGPEDYIRVVDASDTLLALVQPDKSGRSYKYCCVFNY